MTFKAWRTDGEALVDRLARILAREGIDTSTLVSASEHPAYDKYDDYIPAELLRTAYAADRLCAEEVIERFRKESSK
jgi:hypothetical protein